MSLTAGVVLDHARDLHAAFVPQRNPDAVGRRALTRYQQALVRRIVGLGRAQALPLSDATVTLPLADFAAGIDLTAEYAREVLHVKSVHARPQGAADDTLASPVDLVNVARRFGAARAATVDGTRLRLVGTAADWSGVQSVTIRAVQLPADVLTNATALVLPGDALEACACAVASLWAQRLAGIPEMQIDPVQFVTLQTTAENAFLDRLLAQARAEPLRIRRVR